MRVNPARLLTFLICLSVPFASSLGIIIRHDKPDSDYQVDVAAYPQLFYLHTRFNNKICMATLIESHWAITAAHCAEQTPLLDTYNRHDEYQLSIAGQSYKVAELVLHPRYDTGNELDNVDLALIRLDRDVTDIVPITLNRKTDEVNQVFSLLGWGFTGIGTVGMKSNDGKFRRAKNRAVVADQWLEFVFDDPRQSDNQALGLEGVPGLGDSGGPALLEVDNSRVLAGIALGELEVGEAPLAQGLYGTTQLYERVSSHLEWIDSILFE
jgi:chymotrypsin